MGRKQPKKPTSPFGYISFAPDGKVTKHSFQLPDTKEAQEEGVIQSFISRYSSDLDNLTIHDYAQLPEADQDFLLDTSEGDITVQVTELVEREFAFQITKEEYDSGKHSTYLSNGAGQIPLAVDDHKRDMSLTKAIKKKVEKRYSKARDETLWLLIFSTSPSLITVYSQGGETKTSKAYENAVDYVSKQKECVFDAIWFYNMVSRPVRIWPRE